MKKLSTVKLLIIVASLLVLNPVAYSDINTARRYVPDAELVGKTRMKFMVWNAYDAALYAPFGQFMSEQPFALTLNYLRKFSGEDIAARSIKEIRKQGLKDEITLTRWYQQLVDIFPDVNKAIAITGVRDAYGYTHFYKNGNYLDTIEDTLFTKRFFDIWLGEDTSVPKFRNALLGEKN